MPTCLNDGNIGRSVCPGFRKSTYGSSLAKTSETILEIDQIMMSPIELLMCCYLYVCLFVVVFFVAVFFCFVFLFFFFFFLLFFFFFFFLFVCFFIPLAQQLCSEHFPRLHEVLII